MLHNEEAAKTLIDAFVKATRVLQDGFRNAIEIECAEYGTQESVEDAEQARDLVIGKLWMILNARLLDAAFEANSGGN